MQIKKIFREYRGPVISAGILLVSGFGFLFGVIPLIRKTIDVNKEYKVLSDEVFLLTKKASLLKSVDENEIRRNVNTLLTAVPSDKSLTTVLNTLDSVTVQTGVAAGSFSLAKPGSLASESAKRLSADEKAVGSNILPFTVSVQGSFEKIQAFLAMSTAVRRLLGVRTFSVSFTGADTVSANVAMDAYYSPVSSSIGSVSHPVTMITNEENEIIGKVSAMPIHTLSSYTPLPPAAAGVKTDPFSL